MKTLPGAGAWMDAWWMTRVYVAGGVVYAGVAGWREEPIGVAVALVFTLWCLVAPAVAGEVAWWQQVELDGSGWWGPLGRVTGVVLGIGGVARNLERML